MGKSEQRELASRMTVLLAHLLKRQVQPSHRGSSWEATISAQRGSIERRIKKAPSLKNSLADPDWWLDAWGDAVANAAQETELDLAKISKECPWTYLQLMDAAFFPDGLVKSQPPRPGK